MSKKFLLSGIASAFVFALALQAAPAVAGEMHGVTSKDAALEKQVDNDLKSHSGEQSNKANSEEQVARLTIRFFGR